MKDLVIMVLDRPRHSGTDLARFAQAGARIRLIQDGDLSAGIAAAGPRRRRATPSSARAERPKASSPPRLALPLGRDGRAPARSTRRSWRPRGNAWVLGIRASMLAIWRRAIRSFSPRRELPKGRCCKACASLAMAHGRRPSFSRSRTGKVRFVESIHLEKGPDVKVRF